MSFRARIEPPKSLLPNAVTSSPKENNLDELNFLLKTFLHRNPIADPGILILLTRGYEIPKKREQKLQRWPLTFS